MAIYELAAQVEEARAEAAEAQSLVKELTSVAQEARAQAAAAAREAGPALAQAKQSEAQVRVKSLPLLLQLIGCAAVFALLLYQAGTLISLHIHVTILLWPSSLAVILSKTQRSSYARIFVGHLTRFIAEAL